MTEQLCPVCGCTILDTGFEKDDIIYCCLPCAAGSGPCECGCCHPVEEDDEH